MRDRLGVHRSYTTSTTLLCVSLCICLGVFDPSAASTAWLLSAKQNCQQHLYATYVLCCAALCCAGRRARGFQPVHLVVVGLVGGNDASSKLSSTALRQADAGSKDASSAAVAQ